MADLLWLRAIQDFDYCEEKTSETLCRSNSWLYQTLTSVMKLSPKFLMPARVGPLSLTVLTNDIQGASKLFDQAVAAFPYDWQILYRASYQAIYEEKDKAKAAGLLERAGRAGAPAWVYSLATRLYTESGQSELAERLVSEMEGSGISPDLLARMKDRIRSKRR